MRYFWLSAAVAGFAVALLSGGVAHADDTPAKPSHASSVGHSKRVRPAAPDPAPYRGPKPNRAVEDTLMTLFMVTAAFYNPSTPTPIATRGVTVSRDEFDGMPVYTLRKPGSTSDEQVIALHGGAYVGQIGVANWANYAAIARDTGASVIVPVYPLAPTATASVVVPQIASLITQTVAVHGAENVSVLGESAGGGLALAAVQQMVLAGSAVPSRMVLAAPWLDVTISDPTSSSIRDPYLNIGTLRKQGIQWAGNLDPSNPLVSPINGSMTGLPTTFVYSGSRDLLSPQTLRLRDMNPDNVTFVLRAGELHGWTAYPFLPTAIADRPAIEHQLLGQ